MGSLPSGWAAYHAVGVAGEKGGGWMNSQPFLPLRQHGGFYSCDEAMRRVFTGGAREAMECYRQLAQLGDDFTGDRLRGLVVELVLLARGQEHLYWGSFLCPSGRPMTEHEIARAIGWDPAWIGRDLRRIAAAGLMGRVAMTELPGMEAYFV